MNTKEVKKEFGIDLSEYVIRQLTSFSELFKTYNSHTNLMSKNDVNLLFEKHIFDSLAISRFLEKYCEDEQLKILDIGTGGGFPSLPMAIVFPLFEIMALDSIKKKIDFIELAKRELGLGNIKPICCRVEDLQENFKESFDLVTSRAVADLNVILEYAVPFLKIGGYFVAYKSKIADEEIEKSRNALKLLGASIIDKIEYKLPLMEHHDRVLIVIRKEKKTSNRYPRKNGIVKKAPL